MRVAMFSSEFPPGPGGIGTNAYQLARHLQEMSWQVSVVTPQDHIPTALIAPFNRQQPFEIARLRPIPTPPLEAVYRWYIGLRLIRRCSPDVILATGQRAVWIAALLAGSIPLVAIGHGTEFGGGGLYHSLTRRSFEQATSVICVSQFTANVMRASGITPRDGVVIPNGADETRFTVLAPAKVEAFRAGLKLQQARLLLTVGNVTERKGQDIVIRALPSILKQFPQTHYLIAGLPTNAPEFARIAAELGVQDHVHFLGRLEPDHLVAAMNACDLFVMTSRQTASGDVEGYGIAVVEAALCGKPSVVAGGSGLAEALIDGQTGMVVPPDDPAAVAGIVMGLLQDDARRQLMGQAARQRALTEQTWSRRAADYDALLRRIAGVGT